MTELALPQRPALGLMARCTLTLVAFVLLWHLANGADIAKALAQASLFWLAASVAMLVLQTVLSAQRWRVTAAQLGQSFSMNHAVREYFLSQLFNQALPGAVVGDAARAVRAREQGGLLVAGQAVFFERLAGQIAMFLTLSVAFLSTLAVAGGLDWPPALSSGLLTFVFSVTVLLAGLLSLSTARQGTFANARRWLEPLAKALFSKSVLPTQLSLGAAILLCNLLAFGFAAMAVGVELSFIEVTALVPVVLFAMLIPLTVSGWGVREGAAALVLPIAGVSVSNSVAASIMFGVAILIAVAPGALLALKK